jgi:protein tyrosine kinase modulator
MREVVEQVMAQLWVVVHHRYIALFTSIVISCVGWFYVELIPDMYRAETKVYLDTQSILKSLLQGLAIDSDTREQSAQVMQRTLVTRPNMQKVILETDLNLKVNGPQETAKLVDDLMGAIEINSVNLLRKKRSSSNLYYIRYTYEDPDIAKDVIVVLLNIFVESILGENRKDTHDAGEFINEQIREYEKRQYDAEERLKLFKQKNIGVMPEEGRSHYQKLTELASKLEATNLELDETENRIVELERQINTIASSASGARTNSTISLPSPLQARIAEKEKSLDELLLEYTENHPDVINTRLILEQLRLKQENSTPQIGADTGNIDSNLLNLPLYQELKVMQGEAQSQAVALRTRIKQYEKQRVENTKLIKVLSEVEAELTNLNRDYAINQKMYGDLVARRGASELSAKADQSGDKLQFKIIEPPRTPHLPFSPDRILLSTMVMLIAFGGGVGVCLLFEQIKPSFYVRNQLVENIDLPVLGSISMYWTDEEKKKRKFGFILFGAATLVLLMAYIGVLIHNDIASQLGISF